MGDGARRIWVTRASPGAEATAARLEAMGFKSLVDPLLEVRDLSPAIVAWTASPPWPSPVSTASPPSPACTPVGTGRCSRSATARRGRLARPALWTVASADGDVEALAALILRERRAAGRRGAASVRSGAGRRPGLAPSRGRRLSARRLAVYETVDRDPSPATLAGLDSLEAVLLHSPRAARSLARWLAERPAPRLRALCLSAAVARPLGTLAQARGLGCVTSAPHPDETALLDLLTL
jgi:uroporphyrinogen-III synthase